MEDHTPPPPQPPLFYYPMSMYNLSLLGHGRKKWKPFLLAKENKRKNGDSEILKRSLLWLK